MHRSFLNIKIFLPILLGLALLASGCGNDSSEGEISVETGTLSQAEFEKRANQICTTVRNQFGREYQAFVKARSSGSKAKEEETLEETVDQLVVPNYGEQMIEEIAELGVPSESAEEVSAFLTALDDRIGEIEAEPQELIKTAFPFKNAARLATAAGLDDCAASLG